MANLPVRNRYITKMVSYNFKLICFLWIHSNINNLYSKINFLYFSSFYEGRYQSTSDNDQSTQWESTEIVSDSHIVITSKRSHRDFAENSPADDVILPSHSLFVDNSQSYTYTSGSYNKYPPGIVNPAFTGMIIWEIEENHPFNKYNILSEYNLHSGIIMKENSVFIYTQIMNNDIKSFLKPLLKNEYVKINLCPNKPKICKNLYGQVQDKIIYLQLKT